MLCAKRKSDGQIEIARLEARPFAPFCCPECDSEVILRVGSVRLSNFAHKPPVTCEYGKGESEVHRRCKMEIYEALSREPSVTKLALERSIKKTTRPDVSAYINGVPVAIEVQISNLTMETIVRRTEAYGRMGVYVLWLAQWSPYLDGELYSPRLWEKWVHACYFGKVYYWKKGLEIASYHFEPHFTYVPTSSWYSEGGEEMIAGGFERQSKRYRVPIERRVLHLTQDFIPRQRESWESKDYKIPASKLFLERKRAN